jgi:hypothetical protein
MGISLRPPIGFLFLDSRSCENSLILGPLSMISKGFFVYFLYKSKKDFAE